MHLWNEYEGRTIAGSYTLDKLLRSEGRNGFFATSTSTGSSAVIRLTESHFDEEEVLKRWRQVSELHQDNLIDIEGMGKTTFDGVPLTYALMERNDANLEDVLKERPLTTAEAVQVAKSVLAALSALHASGLVHEHIEPINVLAVGDVVKLRSDCVRECVADGEFTSEEACGEVRRRDMHDFGVLLLRCLTLEKELTPGQRLADPFNRIVPGAVEGTLNLAQIDTILNPPAQPVFTPAAPSAYTNGASASNGNGYTPASVRPAAAATAPAARFEPTVRMRSRQDFQEVEPEGSPLKKIVLIAAAALVLLLLGLWVFGSKSANPVAKQPAPVVAPAPPRAVVRATPSAVATSPAAAASGTRAAAGWYVIAYTYNREDQARAKAARVSSRHSGLHAEVVTPSGHGPFLVSVGGPVSQSEAEALWRRARRSGLPRDTFVRHY